MRLGKEEPKRGEASAGHERSHSCAALNRCEGILPALESSHAVAYGMKLAAEMRPDQTVLINLSGRGDKDVQTVAELEGISL